MQEQFDLGREILKWIAIITMTIDHIGAILYPEQTLRLIGRLSFPLFCYLIALGVESTRNIRNYFLRLLLFAFISQIPYYHARELGPFESLNIFFTLSFGVMFIYFLKRRSILSLIPILASFLNFDYSVYGILLIGLMHTLREDTNSGVVSIVLVNLIFLVISPIQIFSLFALPIILLHNNGFLRIYRKPRGKTAYPEWRKNFFYLYYPLHLTLLYLIKLSHF